MNNISEMYSRLHDEVGKAVVGQDGTKEELFCALLSGGHVLLEGVPGIAKTLLVRTFCRAIGADFGRIQFTPDMMPSDVTGSNIYDSNTGAFHFRRGPIFTDLLLADEINRTPPKTQSALLEAMQEKTVTNDGAQYDLGALFTVVATQNPLEFEGTYALPEAQLDRFQLKSVLNYPSEAEEAEVLNRVQAGFDAQDLASAHIQAIATKEDVLNARKEARAVGTTPEVRAYILSIVRTTRETPAIVVGASPRATISLLLTSQVIAALRGRDFVTPDDIKRMAKPVLRHRLILRPEAEIEGYSTDRVVDDVLAKLPVPR
ncbi:MAG: MoxR family ATPase [Fimbriimonadales bacterium]